MKYTQLQRLTLVLSIALGLSACNEEGPEINDGNFLDSAVEGLIYRTNSLEGISNLDGLFQYEDGESVTFFVGDIALPSTRGQSVLTPLDLANTTDVNDPAANNIARLLQSLDSDDDPTNGITITLATRNAANGLSVTDFGDTTLFEAEIADLTTDLVSAEDAADHLSDTIDSLAQSQSTAQLATVSDQSVELVATARLLSSFSLSVQGPDEDNVLRVRQAGTAEVIADINVEDLPQVVHSEGSNYFVYRQNNGQYRAANIGESIFLDYGAEQQPGLDFESIQDSRYIPSLLSPTGTALVVYYDAENELVRVLELL